jgi:phosphonate metabolism protein PhnN/1,5-bisphosphokinase (PRPP-forming)
MLVLVVGASGAGKDTLLEGARAALAGDARFRFVRRQITRRADCQGEDHEPVDAESFRLRLAAGAYALAWEAHGLLYGVPSEIALDLDAGRIVVVKASRLVVAEAARRFRVRVLDVTAPPDLLAARLAARGREDPGDIARRIARSVTLPAGIDIVPVLNDADPATGVGRLVAELRRAAAAVER